MDRDGRCDSHTHLVNALTSHSQPKPGPHIAQMKDSSEFYSNKVIKEFKDK